MSAIIMNSQREKIEKYSIIGVYDWDSGEPGLVVHLGIAVREATLAHRERIPVAHFGLDRRFAPGFGVHSDRQPHELEVGVIGVVEGVVQDADFVEQIEIHLERCRKIRSGHSTIKFRLNPPYTDLITGRTFCFEGNCVTFVCGAFKRGGVQILIEEGFPKVEEDLIRKVFRGDFFKLAANLGVEVKSAPTHCPLPGYLFHALKPDVDEAVRNEPRLRKPYKPDTADEAYFPRIASHAAAGPTTASPAS